MLVEKLVAGSSGVEQRVQQLAVQLAVGLASGLNRAAAKQRALMALSGIVNRQASVLAFGDTFRATAALIFFTLPRIPAARQARGWSRAGRGHTPMGESRQAAQREIVEGAG